MLNVVKVVLLASLASASANAQVVTVDVKIAAVDLDARIISVEHNGKTTDLDISRKATILVSGAKAEASSLIVGDEATIEYHKELEVVTKIEAKGLVQDGWKFYDVFGKGINPQRAFTVARDGQLVMQGTVGGFCLATLKPHSEFTLKLEFQFLIDNFKGGPFVGIASTLPNPKATNWEEKIPYGIEIKLHPANIGEIIVPNNFKVELPLGQLRDDRRIVSLRTVESKAKVWNTLEVKADKHRNVTVKVNGTTVNAIAKAENTSGHIIIMPQNSEIQLRNALLIEGDVAKQLAFDNIALDTSQKGSSSAVPEQTGNGDGFQVGSVWQGTGESVDLKLTVIERSQGQFKAIYESPLWKREVSGTINGRKFSWKQQDVKAIRGGAGGDNFGTIISDGEDARLEIEWRGNNKSGTDTLQRKL